MPGPNPRAILDDEELTQYGTTATDWTDKPKWGQDAVSVLLGRLTGEDAADRIRAAGARRDGTEVARYTTAGRLRSAGFAVTHTPGRVNRLHVSITSDGPWNADAFVKCFT